MILYSIEKYVCIYIYIQYSIQSSVHSHEVEWMTATVASCCQDTGSTPPCDGLLKSVSMASQICKAGDVETGCEKCCIYVCAFGMLSNQSWQSGSDKLLRWTEWLQGWYVRRISFAQVADIDHSSYRSQWPQRAIHLCMAPWRNLEFNQVAL